MLIAPVASSLYPVAYNYSVKLFLDGMVAEDPLTYHAILWPIGLFIGAQLVHSGAWRLSNVAEWKAEPYVRRSIILGSYDYVQHHSYAFFQNNFTGAISSKIKGLWDGYDKFWAEMHHGLVKSFLKSAVNLCALALVSGELFLFMVVWSMIYGTAMYKLSIKLNQLSCEESESAHGIIGKISDNVTNVISLFSFASRTEEYRRLEESISRDFIPKQFRTYKYNFKFQCIGDVLYFIMMVSVLFIMVHLRMQGKISIGDFAFVFGIVFAVAFEIWHTTISLQDFSRAMGNVRSALSILQIPQENQDIAGAKSLILTEPSIKFQKITFGYDPAIPVLKNLSLTIRPGEKIGLVGHSGAGKSSLVNLLLRYFSPTKGHIFINEQDIDLVTQDSVRENIAVIPQDILLFHRTLMDNIRYGNPIATDKQVIEASKKAHIHDFIMGLPDQYNTYVGERGIKLSGGQRQRIAIARAILKDAPILVLDEATSSLDSQTEKLIQESLNFLIKDKKKTVIAVAHRLSTLKYMDKIIVLDKGVIVEEGTHAVLIKDKNSLYRRLWELQEIG